jgi:hypothetical protein
LIVVNFYGCVFSTLGEHRKELRNQ